MRKNRTLAPVLKLLSLMILMGTAVWTVLHVSMITQTDTELVYWERARFLLGQGGASTYSGSSLCSLGYSLLLLPFCAWIKSAYAAYKAAILLNGFFLCLSYLTVCAVARELYGREGKVFCAVAAFFAVYTPAFVFSKTCTGPAMAVLFLSWFAVYLLVLLWKRYSRVELALLTLVLSLIGFLQISALGLIFAIAGLLAFYVTQKRMEETSYLCFLLALLLGLAAGNIAECIVLTSFGSTLGLRAVDISASLNVFLDGIVAGWEKGYLFGAFKGLVGKLYVLLIGSVLSAGIPLLRFLKSLKGKNDRKKESQLESGLFLVFLAQLLVLALYDRSRDVGTAYLSVEGLEMVISVLSLMGVAALKRSRVWERELTGVLLFLCVSTFFVAQILQDAGTTSLSSVRSGFLILFQLAGTTPIVTVYMATILVVLAAIVLVALLCQRIKNRRLSLSLRMLGGCAVLAIFVAVQLAAVEQVSEADSDSYLTNFAPVASVLSEIPTEYVCTYVLGTGNDSGVMLVQSLLPNRQIQLVESGTKSWTNFCEGLSDEDENLVILTGTNETSIRRTFEPGLSGYKIVYMTQNLALWARCDSEACAALEERVQARMEELSSNGEPEEVEAETESTDANETQVCYTQSFGGSVLLAAGTYRIIVPLTRTTDTAFSGTVAVADSTGTLYEAEVDESCFGTDNTATLRIEVTSRSVMRNVKVTVAGTILSAVQVGQVTYCKESAAYTVWLNEETDLDTLASTIKKWDKKAGETGSVAFLDYLADDVTVFDTKEMASRLGKRDLSVYASGYVEEATETYVIGTTQSHIWYTLMEEYSIIYRGSDYTLLVRNDSAQYAAYVEKKGAALSCGTRIAIEAFTGKKKVKTTTKFKLEKGDYNYIAAVTVNPESLPTANTAVVGTLYVKKGDTVLAVQTVSAGELRSGSAEISIALALSSEKKIYLEAVWEEGVEATALPAAIELASELCQYGKGNEELGAAFERINELVSDVSVYVVRSRKRIAERTVGFDDMQQKLSNCTVGEIDFDTASALAEDGLLVTNGLSVEILGLLANYSIVYRADKYVIWVRNDGEALQKLTAGGFSILNNGSRLSPELLAGMTGDVAVENQVAYLPAAKYKVYLEVSVADLPANDTVEISLLRDLTETELAEEVEALLEEGYTQEEAEDKVDTQTTCGSATYEAYRFADTDTLLISITTTGSALTNLTCDSYTWRKAEVDVRLLWVELVG